MFILQNNKLITLKEDEFDIITANYQESDDPSYTLHRDNDKYIFLDNSLIFGLSGKYDTIGDCIIGAIANGYTVYKDGVKIESPY